VWSPVAQTDFTAETSFRGSTAHRKLDFYWLNLDFWIFYGFYTITVWSLDFFRFFLRKFRSEGSDVTHSEYVKHLVLNSFHADSFSATFTGYTSKRRRFCLLSLSVVVIVIGLTVWSEIPSEHRVHPPNSSSLPLYLSSELEVRVSLTCHKNYRKHRRWRKILLLPGQESS